MFCEEIVTLPFSNQQLQEKFSNVYEHYVIDYEESKLKDNGFLSYMRNANIEAVIVNPSVDLMIAYISNINTIPKSNLSAIHADLLFLYVSGGKDLHTGCVFDFFSQDQINSIIDNTKEVLSLQISLIESLPMYVLLHCSTNNSLKNSLIEQSDDLVIQEDILAKSGKTWLNVAVIPDFMSMLIQVNRTKVENMKFYLCLDEYAFGGKNLIGALGSMKDRALQMFFSNVEYVTGQK